MKYFLVIFSFVSFLSLAETISSESFLSDLNKISENYKKLDQYSMQVKHSSYIGEKSQVPYETVGGYYKKNGRYLESTVLGIHTLNNSELELNVNISSRIAVLTNSKKEEVVDMEAIKAYLSAVENITKEEQKEETIYTMNFKEDSELKYFKFTTNPNGFITEINYLYAKSLSYTQPDGKKLEGQPKVKITYTEIRTKGVEDLQNKMNSYLIKNEEGYKLTGKYSQYEFYDNRIKK